MNYTDMSKEVVNFFATQKNLDLSSSAFAEYSAMAKALEGKVGSFLQTSGLSAAQYVPGAAMEAMGDISASIQRYGVDKIVSWLQDEVKIPETHLKQAALSVVNVLTRHEHQASNSGLWTSQQLGANRSNGIQYQALESIYSDEVAASMKTQSVGLEAFGVDINTTPADLKTALVLTLLQYYIGLIPRVLPTLPTNQPAVIFTKARRKVMDLAESENAKYNFLELMRNPDLLWGELKPIIPLGANATNGEILKNSASEPIDGVLVPAIEANILQLALDTTKYGHSKINMTDTVADNVSVNSVYVTISNGTNTDTFVCPIHTTFARLTRTNNSKDAADRQAMFSTKIAIKKGSKNAAGEVTALLTGAEEGEGLLISITASASINLKTGIANAMFSTKVGAYTPVGTEPTQGLLDIISAIDEASVKPEVVGYTLDARYTEDNFRKTSKLATIDKQQISYELMQGTNYFVQVSLQDKQQEDATVDLGQLIQLEEDAKQLRAIEGVINKVDQALRNEGALNPVDDIGAEYIAGDIVFPATYSTTLNVAKLKVLQTGDVQGDVRSRVRTFLGYVTTELVRLSLIDKVLTNGAEINFGLITNRRVLDNCLSVKHYHNHLNGGDTEGTNNGIEFRLVLDNGIILNVVTTTFNEFYGKDDQGKNWDKMILFPIMPNSPDSYLNFGQIYDYGAMSGRYSFSDRGSTVERIFANVRRQLIPTNPQGAIIDIKGIEEIMADAVYAKALTDASETSQVRY